MSRSDVYSKNFTIELSSSNASASFMKNSQSEKLVNSYLLVLCCVIVLTWYIQWLWKRRYLYIHSWNIPGPLALPFIGSGYLFIFSTTSDILLETVHKIQKRYPEICALWIGPKLVITVAKPEYVEKILTSSKALNKSDLYKFLTFAVGEGLLTAKVQKWRKHRKIIMPAFNQRILNKYQEIFLMKGEVFADILEKNDGNKEIDFFELASNCTLDIICETALGLDMKSQTSNSDFGKKLDRFMEITTYRISHLWHHLEFTWNWCPLSGEFDKLLEALKKFSGAVIKKKLEVCNNKQSSVDCFASTKERGSSDKFAFLDLILGNSNFTELELREEVDIFLAAGTDTTASTLSCVFTMLGMFQDVQQKVLEEILEIVGPDRRVLPCDMPEMKYTERVIKESLRLFPVAAFFGRTISEDIDAGDVVFPAGSDVYFGVVHIHRNPKYWTDPLKFDPDRFLPENVAKRHPCTYIPFSYGPRNCVAGKYAMINIKTILAIVLRRFIIYTEYKSIEEIKLKINVLLRMNDGPKVWVESR